MKQTQSRQDRFQTPPGDIPLINFLWPCNGIFRWSSYLGGSGLGLVGAGSGRPLPGFRTTTTLCGDHLQGTHAGKIACSVIGERCIMFLLEGQLYERIYFVGF